MADLVQDRPPHLLHQIAITPAGLLMRVFVQGDALRQTLTCPERARSFVEPHQAIPRPLFEDEHGVLEIGLELFGNRVDRGLRRLLELLHADLHAFIEAGHGRWGGDHWLAERGSDRLELTLPAHPCPYGGGPAS